MASSLVDTILAKTKAASAHLTSKDVDKLRASIRGCILQLWPALTSVIATGRSDSAVLNALRVLSLLFNTMCSSPPEDVEAFLPAVPIAATLDTILTDCVLKKAGNSCTFLSSVVLLQWATSLPKQLLDNDGRFETFSSRFLLESAAQAVGNLGTQKEICSNALSYSLWLTTALRSGGKTQQAFHTVLHLAWPALLQLAEEHARIGDEIDTTDLSDDDEEGPQQPSTPSIHAFPVAAAKIQTNLADLLSSDAGKKMLSAEGAKLPSGSKWSMLVLPAAGSSYSEAHEVNAWTFNAMANWVRTTHVPFGPLKSYCMTLLDEVSTYARGSPKQGHLLASSQGGGLSINYVSCVVTQTMEILSEMMLKDPDALQDVKGEVMGVFFQLQNAVRGSGSTPMRAFLPVVSGWTGDDAVTKATITALATCSDQTAPPTGVLMASVPSGLHDEAIGERVHWNEGQRSGRDPHWKGEVLLSFLDFFSAGRGDAGATSPVTPNASTTSNESAVLEAFFGPTAQWWDTYAQSPTFAPTLFRYLTLHAHRPLLSPVLLTIHPRLLKLVALSPHTLIHPFRRLLPSLLHRSTYLDLFHRILDLPLLSHLLAKQPDTANLKQLCGNNQFQLSFVSSLLTDSLGEGGECTPYCTFWADHSQGTDDWITNIEPWKLSVKATVASSYVVPLLDDFFGLALPEAGKDPVIAAHLASAIIRRYHTVSLTSSTMTELQPLLLRRLYQLVDASPQLVVLAEKDITAALRQQHISNPQHRSPSLSAAVSSTYMQYVLHTTRPKAGDEVLAPKPPSRESLTIFTELIGALYDTIDVLSKRAAPQKSAPPNLPPARTTPIVDMVVYGTQRRMYDTQNYPLFPTPPQPRPSRRGRTTRQQVHEAMEAQYTVWNAAEAVNALLLTAVTMALRHSAFLPQAVSLCHAVIAAGEQRVLPPAVTQSAASQLVWLERPASAAALLLRPSPACGAAPLAADHTAPIFAFVPHCLRDTADLRL